MKRYLAVAVAAIFSLSVAAVALAEDAKPAAAPAGPVYGMGVGALMKPVKLKTLDGKAEVDTAKASANEKAVFVIVNSVCGVCNTEIKDLMANADTISSKAKLYVVVVDQNAERLLAKYEKLGDKFTLLHDPDFTIGAVSNLFSTPSTIILDKGGKFLYAMSGYRKDMMEEYKKVLQ